MSFQPFLRGYALYIHYPVADSPSSVDEAYGYVMKEEEDSFVDETLSSFYFQQKYVQNVSIDLEACDSPMKERFDLVEDIFQDKEVEDHVNTFFRMACL